MVKIHPVVGKTYLTNDGKKFKCIYQIKGEQGDSFSFVRLDDYGNEYPYNFCSDDEGEFGPLLYLVREYLPYEDFKIDEPVMVRDEDSEIWNRRYFAGVSDCGKPMTYPHGITWWTSNFCVTNVWNQCMKPTKEELAHQLEKVKT